MSSRSELLQRLTDCDQWNSRGVSPRTRIESLGNAADCLSYSLILWPDFIQHDECVLWKGVDNYEEWKQAYAGDRTRVEAMMNHLHISDLFQDRAPKSRDVVLALGRLLKETWAAKLAQDFPSRSFVVSFPDDFETDHLEEYEITFYEDQKSAE